MANTHSALAPVNFKPMVQDFLNARLVAKSIARMETRDVLRSGQSIDWPYITDLRVQTYTPGTDLTIDNNVATSNTMAIDQSRAATFTLDPNAQAQAEDKSIQAELADQAAYRIANDVDQKTLGEGVTYAGSTITGGVLSTSNVYQKLVEGLATLQRNNATDRTLFAVLDPETCALLAQVEVANGFNLADSALKNGFVGPSHAGFNIYNSNNLPTTVTLTVDTEPTNTNTMTLFGVTFTFVTAGTATNPGEISLDGGGTVTDTQLVIVNAINGTGTPGASTYIELSVENRRKLQNAGVSAATFGGNASVITGYGKVGAAETFTAATNGFGAETTSMLLGSVGSISLGMQILPEMYVGKEAKRPESNYIIHTLFGKKVFYRDTQRLVKMTRTAQATTI